MLETLSREILDRNEIFVREHLHRHLTILLKNATSLMDKALSGVLILLRIPARIFFYPFIKKYMKRSAEKAIDFLIDLVREMLEKGMQIGSEEFEEAIEEAFPNWLNNDHILQWCSIKHKNYEEIKAISKIGFRWQVIPITKFLSNSDTNLKHYPDLCRSTFERPEDCRRDLDQQLDAIKDGIEVAGRDVNIYKIPFLRRLFHKNLKKLLDQMIQDFYEDIDAIYKFEVDHLYKGEV